ncbi:MAG: DUF4080 domain-containing protein [Planctomycetes bacterium]|nr:DUF4080 domain-containing protein [Planctomycetota bacterium]
MADIVLATHNCRWQHTSFGLRCLRANLGALRERATIVEFELNDRAADVVERLLAERPRIVGLGVYLWNAAQALDVVRTLKQVAPAVAVVLGGPEVSHESERQEVCALADHVVRGEGDVAFRELCEALLAGFAAPHTIDAPLPHLEQLAWPYDEYTDRDLAHRVVYVESSRGCPFTCEFCLSALEVPVRKAPLQSFLAQMQRLLDRGLRHFKFVDRTFNLGIDVAVAILDFFRERLEDGMFLHFELIPDRLPDKLKDAIAAFPPGVLQFEVGVQTLDDATGLRISRRQDRARLHENLRWLHERTGAHVHADLIVGLPGEDEATFARGFDELLSCAPHEIQVGILKRLRGTPIVRHDQTFGMRYAEDAPYEVLATDAVPFATMQRMKRFARYWDVVANSGNWKETLPLLLAGRSAHAAFASFADWLHAETRATAGIALPRLAALLWRWLVDERGHAAAAVGAAMAADYDRCARHDWPAELTPFAPARPQRGAARGAQVVATSRQARHRGDA